MSNQKEQKRKNTMNTKRREPEENHEIIGLCINGIGWPFEPERRQSIDEVARELKACLFERRECPEIEESFRNHGYSWQEVDWEMLAESMMADIYGDDWDLKMEFRFLGDTLQARNMSEIVDRLRAIANDLEGAEDPDDIYDEDKLYAVDWIE